MKTESAKLNQRGEVIIGDRVEPRKWYVVDAAGFLPVTYPLFSDRNSGR